MKKLTQQCWVSIPYHPILCSPYLRIYATVYDGLHRRVGHGVYRTRSVRQNAGPHTIPEIGDSITVSRLSPGCPPAVTRPFYGPPGHEVKTRTICVRYGAAKATYTPSSQMHDSQNVTDSSKSHSAATHQIEAVPPYSRQSVPSSGRLRYSILGSIQCARLFSHDFSIGWNPPPSSTPCSWFSPGYLRGYES